MNNEIIMLTCIIQIVVFHKQYLFQRKHLYTKRVELELCEDLSGAYLRHTDEEKHILINLLCSNFLYDGSKVIITIKRAFIALFDFAIFENGASKGRELEDNCIRLAQLSLHESELITNIKQIICLC